MDAGNWASEQVQVFADMQADLIEYIHSNHPHVPLVTATFCIADLVGSMAASCEKDSVIINAIQMMIDEYNREKQSSASRVND